MRLRFGAVASTIIMVAACETPTAPAAAGWVPRYSGNVTFSGRVLDNVSGVGVSNATVQFSQRYPPPFPILGVTTTDAAGSFTLNIPRGEYLVSVGGAYVGGVRVTAFAPRGDLFVNPSNCGSRYGVVSDLLTGRPIAGASVRGPVLTDSDGWYRWNSCPEPFDFGTRAIYVSHPDYVAASIIIGRGFIGVSRLDVGLVRRARPAR